MMTLDNLIFKIFQTLSGKYKLQNQISQTMSGRFNKLLSSIQQTVSVEILIIQIDKLLNHLNTIVKLSYNKYYKK